MKFKVDNEYEVYIRLKMDESYFSRTVERRIKRFKMTDGWSIVRESKTKLPKLIKENDKTQLNN